MSFSHFKTADPRALVWTLVAAEILTARGQAGPLARPWRPVGRRPRGETPPAPKPSDRPTQG